MSWNEIDTAPLKAMGICERHLNEIKGQGRTNPSTVQNAIYYFSNKAG
jgi:hypothetical protein